MLLSHFTDQKTRLFQYLFKVYSKLAITENTDRPFAISSLEQGLGNTFQTHVKHGVFERYLHRSLSWFLDGDHLGNWQIQYESQNVPSWSWMRYVGPIDYLPNTFGDTEWNQDVRLVNGGDALEAVVNDLCHKRMRPVQSGRACGLLDSRQEEAGRIVFDEMNGSMTQESKCVVLGRSAERSPLGTRSYCILVVVPSFEKGNGVYRRVGVGYVQTGFIAFSIPGVTSRII
jgi:hypothetical protein